MYNIRLPFHSHYFLYIFIFTLSILDFLADFLSTRGGPKLALRPGSLILIYQGLEEENLDQKSPGPPGWGLMQWASSSLITKNKKC
jgi:hypothetical protein